MAGLDARADVVDDAYAEGSRAAARNDWATAVEHWERARKLLPRRSAQLSYDLGTAYANLGELGYATYHLERALDERVGADAQLSESARRNLAIVRRRIELANATREAKLSEPADWRDTLVAIVSGSWFAALNLFLGTGALIAAGARAIPRLRNGATPLALFLALLFLVTGATYLVARDADRAGPSAIVLQEGAILREGPGAHQSQSVTLSAGSRVWVEERRSGWALVRMPGGLGGWIAAEAIGSLEAAPGAVGPAPLAKATSADDADAAP